MNMFRKIRGKHLYIVISFGIGIIFAIVGLCFKRNQTALSIYKIYENIYVKLQQGYTLSAAMEAQGVAFPNLMIQMYRSGEASGDMDKTALTMSNQYSKDHRIKGKTKSAMMYPIISVSYTHLTLPTT